MYNNTVNSVLRTSCFSQLMDFYEENYQLMRRLDLLNNESVTELQLVQESHQDPHTLPSYRLYLKRLDKQPYTETLHLTYNAQKHQLGKPVPVMQVNVDVYHDTRQAGALALLRYDLKHTPFALRMPALSHLRSLSQKKYYANLALHTILKRFAYCSEADNVAKLQYNTH